MLANNTEPPTGDRLPPAAPSAVESRSGGPAAVCSCELDSHVGSAGPILVLRVAGEIDVITQRVVQSAIESALRQTPQDLVVDLAGVGFCCVRGFALLVESAALARAAGIGYSLSGMSGRLGRVSALLWPDLAIVRYRSVAAAVTTLRVAHT